MRCTRQLTAVASVVLLILAALNPASGRGGLSREHWSATRIKAFPREVRMSLERWASTCGEPLSAGNLFDRYIQDHGSGNQFIALHFHDLRCDHQLVCKASGCLHHVYASKGGAYRLVWSNYARDIELKQLGNGTGLEITCDSDRSGCARHLRWNGSQFVNHTIERSSARQN
jgi:hypothetical protein